MDARAEIQAMLPKGTHLTRAHNQGCHVWAARCATHARGIHRYTLSDGTACWDYWPTLEAVRQDLTAAGPR